MESETAYKEFKPQRKYKIEILKHSENEIAIEILFLEQCGKWNIGK